MAKPVQSSRHNKVIDPILKAQEQAWKSRSWILVCLWVLFTLLNLLLFLWAGLSIMYAPLILLPGFTVLVSLWFGGRFIDQLFELKNLIIGLKHLIGVLFGQLIPRVGALIFKQKRSGSKEPNTKSETESDEPDEKPDESPDAGSIQSAELNPLVKLGGPYYVDVPSGQACVIESMFGMPRVIGEGVHFVSSHERIKETVSLEDREHWIPSIKATTSDGIQIEVIEVHYRYRNYSPKRRTLQEFYPFDEVAVLNMVYNRSMLADRTSDWDEGIQNLVESEIKKYISRHPLDQLTAPGLDCDELEDPIEDSSQCDARREITNRFKDPEVRQNFQVRGAEVTWFDVGHISIPNPAVTEQRLKVWQTRWDIDATRMLTDAESRRLTIQDRGRAEAQADMLLSIVHALEDIDLQGDSRQHVHKLVLIRLAQILDTLGDHLGENEP